VELPTYTNIWKIEKRLYKLYDFRLPMPLPVGQIVAFLAIAVPYTLVLTMAGMPFSHTWLWLYVLPPGLLAWLVTRPVLEGKRLPELLLSQLRYLGEPRTWCRMTPLAEKDEMLVVARAWRSAARPAESTVAVRPVAVRPATAVAELVSEPGLAEQILAEPGLPEPGVPEQAVPVESGPESTEPAAAGRPEWPKRAGPRLVRERSAIQPAAAGWVAPEPSAPAQSSAAAPAAAHPAAVHSAAVHSAAAHPGAEEPAAATSVPGGAAAPAAAEPDSPPASRPVWPNAPASTARPGRGVVQVTGAPRPARPLNTVERALRSSPSGWKRHEPVVVVPGGHRPGKPDQVQRDQARARQPLPGPARIVVLGCTAGAGQTVVTLLTGQLLTSLRAEPVAVLDLGEGQGSLTERARSIPVLLPSARAGGDPASKRAGAGERGLQVVSAAGSDPGQVIDSIVERYPLVLTDPDAGSVPKSLRVADQLILVAPASEEAANSLAMTLEWLDANGYGRLAEAAIIVLNGVSSPTSQHAARAVAVASGRCRAIVQVPWDERLRGPAAQAGGTWGRPPGPAQPLATPTVRAYTALAGVVVAALAEVGSEAR
jgi:hypothetical protein